MSRLLVGETADGGQNELDLTWAFSTPTLDDLGDELYEDDDFEDSRDLDDWLSDELGLGQEYDD